MRLPKGLGLQFELSFRPITYEAVVISYFTTLAFKDFTIVTKPLFLMCLNE